jgi:hypothetical protein
MNKHVAIHYLMEFLFIYQLLAFFTLAVHDALPTVFPFVLLSLSGIALSLLMKQWNNDKMPIIFSVVSLFMLSIIGVALGYLTFLAVALSIAMSFRLFSSLQSLDDDKDGLILILTSIGAIMQYWIFSNYEYYQWLVLFILAQFILIILKKMFSQVDANATKTSNRRITILFSLLGVSFIAVLFLPIIRFLVHKVFIGGGLIVFSVFYPIITWVSSLLPESQVQEEEVVEEEEESPLLPPTNDEEEEYSRLEELIVEPNPIDFNPETMIILLLGLALVLFALYVFFKEKGSILPNKMKGYFVKSEIMDEQERKPLFYSHKVKAPSNKVRKLFFQFEKKLRKTEMARDANQTVDEWLHQLKGEDFQKKAVSSLYQKVRYGEAELTEAEVTEFKESLNELQQVKYKKKKVLREKQESLREKTREIKDRHFWR